ncbi:MAG: FAD-binding oxidoreductase, partial [Novipirellula sp. JB048]
MNSTHHALARLTELLPPERVMQDSAFGVAFASDGLTAFHQKPLAVVIPETTEEVITVVHWCHREQIPFVARGSGTSLSGGSLPIPGGIVIALNRLKRILSLDPVDRIAVVEPGVINIKVTEAASPHGLYFAPDPSSQTVCTIGGNVAFNSGGAHCLKYGMTSNHVIGMKGVLANGECFQFGSSSTDTIGPDYPGLFCGSEGLFGIATEVTLRLLPKPEKFHTVLVGYRSLQAAGDAVSAVIEAGLL